MAERGAEAEIYTNIIEFMAFRQSAGMDLCYTGLEGDFQRALSVYLNTITDNIQIDTPADNAALETAPTYKTATMSTSKFSRALIRGTSQHNIVQAMEGPGPARLDQQLMDRLAQKMATKLDDQIFAKLTGATYGSSAGNGFVIDAVGQAFSGTNASGLDRDTGRYKSKGTAPSSQDEIYRAIVDGMGDAEVIYRDSDLVDGNVVGDAAPNGFRLVCPNIVARALVDWAIEKGDADQPGSVGREAASVSGILGPRAYRGTVHNIDIIGTTALKPSSTAKTVNAYTVPVASALAAGVRPMLWDFARYGQGNTGGAAIARSTVICPYFAGVQNQGILGRMAINVN